MTLRHLTRFRYKQRDFGVLPVDVSCRESGRRRSSSTGGEPEGLAGAGTAQWLHGKFRLRKTGFRGKLG